MDNEPEVRRLLIRAEIARSKVRWNKAHTKIINPYQQAAYTKLYKRAYKLCDRKDFNKFITIHIEVCNELSTK